MPSISATLPAGRPREGGRLAPAANAPDEPDGGDKAAPVIRGDPSQDHRPETPPARAATETNMPIRLTKLAQMPAHPPGSRCALAGRSGRRPIGRPQPAAGLTDLRSTEVHASARDVVHPTTPARRVCRSEDQRSRSVPLRPIVTSSQSGGRPPFAARGPPQLRSPASPHRSPPNGKLRSGAGACSRATPLVPGDHSPARLLFVGSIWFARCRRRASSALTERSIHQPRRKAIAKRNCASSPPKCPI